MPFHRDEFGNEVDEYGYVREVVEGWAQHGVYPPPIIGNWNNPRVVEMAKADRARIAQLPPEEQERWYEAERREAGAFWGAFFREGGRLIPRDTKDSGAEVLGVYFPSPGRG